MSKKLLYTVLAVVALSLALGACGPTAAPAATQAPAAAVTATRPPGGPAPAATATTAAPAATATTAAPAATATVAKKALKVGLVTDTGGVNDKSFNQSAWAGVQKAMKDFGVDAKFIESKQPTDYEKNIDLFLTDKYDVVITVGFLMGDATGTKAKTSAATKFAIIDYGYFPTKGDKVCDDTKKDCYADGGLSNVSSLLFQEDQVGYLAGVLAAGVSKSGTVCTVSGMEIPPVVRYVVGFQNGAKSVKPAIKTLNVYIPSFVDPAKGKETGQSMINQGCDVVFGVGGNTGNGGLLAAKEKGLMAIGVDVDQYNTYPEVKDALITSAQKNVDVAVYEYLKSVLGGSAKGGILTANVQNGGVGLAPYHDWDSKIPQAVKDSVTQATADLKSGKVTTGYKP
jgi:basic membrane protein A